MAKQKSFLKIDGTLGGLTFYKSGGEYLIKTKSEVSKDKIDNSPNFQRTRENNGEFGMSTKAAKLLRLGLRNVLKNASDKYVVSRLVKQMMLIRKYDFTSNRGMRSVAVGI